jgi:hypothetical protein
MNDLNVAHVALTVMTGVIQSLELEDETKHLKTLTNAHRDACVTGLEQVIDNLQKAIKTMKSIDYDKEYR